MSQVGRMRPEHWRSMAAALVVAWPWVSAVRAETSSWSTTTDPQASAKPKAGKPAGAETKTMPVADPAAKKGNAPAGSATFSKQPGPEMKGALVPATGDEAAYLAFDQGQYLTAKSLAEEAAAKGDAPAHTLIGRIYAEGLGVGRDFVKAAEWYKRGADLGDINASFALGVLLAEGKGVKKDRKVAAELFEKAAMTGHAEANYNLGLLFLKGDGKPENPYRGAQHIAFAASKGVAQAQYDLGALYQAGTGVPFDAVEASNWLRKAAEQGHTQAQYDYAVLLLKGLGLTADEPKAVAYLRSAADKGVPGAQNRLAHLYLEGIGVEKSAAEAAKWRLVAKSGGVEDGKLDELIAKMPKAERAAAEKSATEWIEARAAGPAQ